MKAVSFDVEKFVGKIFGQVINFFPRLLFLFWISIWAGLCWRSSKSLMPTLRSTFRESNKAAPWKTTPKLDRHSCQSSGLKPQVNLSSMNNWPSSGSSNPKISLMVTDFPLPLPPNRQKRLPSCISKEMSSRMDWLPKALYMFFRWIKPTKLRKFGDSWWGV